MVKNRSNIEEYIQALTQAKRLQHQVVYHHVIPERISTWEDLKNPFPGQVAEVLRALGIKRLYRHQAQGVDRVRSNQHVVVATPTAKTTITPSTPPTTALFRRAKLRSW